MCQIFVCAGTSFILVSTDCCRLPIDWFRLAWGIMQAIEKKLKGLQETKVQSSEDKESQQAKKKTEHSSKVKQTKVIEKGETKTNTKTKTKNFKAKRPKPTNPNKHSIPKR